MHVRKGNRSKLAVVGALLCGGDTHENAVATVVSVFLKMQLETIQKEKGKIRNAFHSAKLQSTVMHSHVHISTVLVDSQNTVH